MFTQWHNSRFISPCDKQYFDMISYLTVSIYVSSVSGILFLSWIIYCLAFLLFIVYARVFVFKFIIIILLWLVWGRVWVTKWLESWTTLIHACNLFICSLIHNTYTCIIKVKEQRLYCCSKFNNEHNPRYPMLYCIVK